MFVGGRVTLKDHLRESLLFNQRLLVATALGGLMLVALVVRMGYLEIISHAHYTTLSEKNRVSILPIPPTRGLIYDRNGVVLAQNLPSYTLELVPERVQDMDATLRSLRKLVAISDEDTARFERRMKTKRRFEGVPLRFRLSDEEVARLAVHRHRLPGVDLQARLVRHYPLGALASHAVGYVGRINEQELRRIDPSDYSGTSHIGKVGVERHYEDMLHGTVGYRTVETNAEGRIVHELEGTRTLPVPGSSLFLNLDVRLQQVAQAAFGEENGALVAIDPNTGAVLAMVSVPGYDPNLFVNGIDTATYRALSQSTERPLFNRALQGQYPPGSTLKPMIGLAGLELGMVGSAQSLTCAGWYTLKNDERRYRDWKKEGHGETDLDRAIVESCDVYFYDLSLALGIDNMHAYLSEFGVGRKTGIDLPGELGGLMPSREWKRRTRNLPWFPGETLITGIGQGFMLSTPLQLAAVTATLSMHGERFEPQMVYGVRDPDTRQVSSTEPQALTRVNIVEPRNWDKVINSMERVVHSLRGTARSISRNLNYRIAGKTGTAQVFGIKQDEEYVEEDIAKKLRDHALFVAFAPADRPRIAVAVIVENGGSGGSVAAPIVRKVMDAWLLGKDHGAG